MTYPERDPYRARLRAARVGRTLGAVSLACLAAVVVLWLLDVERSLWRRLVAIAFVLAIGGTASAAVVFRDRRLRRESSIALGVAASALVAATLIRFVLWKFRN